MKVYAFVGHSGTGKSHMAAFVAHSKKIKFIVDDGLLISGTTVLAGLSAKREPNKLAAVRRALFTDKAHIESVVWQIKKHNPKSIMVLGTSMKFVHQIAKQLELPPISEIIHIEDVSTPQNIELALKMRNEQGKHVIPVPTLAIKRHFSGIFIDSIKSIIKGRRTKIKLPDTTVVRPTFSYLGKYTIAHEVIVQYSWIEALSVDGCCKVTSIDVQRKPNGAYIEIEVVVAAGYRIKSVCKKIVAAIERSVEKHTAINVLNVELRATRATINK